MKNRSENILFSILQEHPSVAAGMCTFAVAFTIVAGNAIYAQSGSHPVPLWATRDHVTTQSIQANSGFKPDAFKPVIRPVKTTMHKPKVAATNSQGTKATNNSTVSNSPIVSGVQRGLLASGDYKGGIDGQIGPMTRAAISVFQKRNGLAVDGYASKALLNYIDRKNTKSASNIAPTLKPTKAVAVKYDTAIVKKIQQGLYNFGEPEISVDGVYGSQTAAAIMRFQEKFNLTKTGIPDVALVKELVSKNALPSG